jgi:ribonuclease HI
LPFVEVQPVRAVINNYHLVKQYNLVNTPIVIPTPIATPVDSSLSDVVLKYIPTPVTRSQLRQLKQDFKFARTLEFYTDGSMMAHRTDQCVMGIGWIQVDIDNDIPSRTFSAQVQLFPSALRAEIYAVLSALCTAPKFCVVTIVTDNKNVEVGLRHICSHISSTPSHLKDLFASNATLWAAIAYIIETQELMCSIRKIKSHSSSSNLDPA